VPDSHHHVHFNRGAAASQEYSRRFGDRSPEEVGPAAFKWLSRGASEAIQGFIARAAGPGWGMRIGAYEFTDPDVLTSVKAASKKTKDVEVLYHARNDSQKKANEDAIALFALKAICTPRTAKGLSLSHNKFVVLTRAGVAEAVLTGSTNFSRAGIYGHSNVVHVCEDPAVAAQYLWFWNELKRNDGKKVDAPIISARTPLPGIPLRPGTTQVFSPRVDLEALQWYASRAKEAKDALFMTFAFGMHDLFQDAYKNGKARLRYALMEKMSGPTKSEAQRKANEAKIVALRKMEDNKFAVGSYLSKSTFDRWLAERLSGLNANVRYLHTKYMLVDPLGKEPIVVSGSANFSEASTLDNDENMLIVSSYSRIADIYLGEFMRLYNHFAFRDWLSHHPNQDESKVSHLDEKDVWWKAYFGGSFASRQREYFAG
jgi:phosphatidylserine/phosphatidylglycerophosphate/cardiolipin synthase-like enzyme